MPKGKLSYYGNCVGLPGRFINNLIDREIDISYKTFRKYVSGKDLRAEFPIYDWGVKGGLHLQDDWSVSFHRSKYKGKFYYYMKQSGIEHIWC